MSALAHISAYGCKENGSFRMRLLPFSVATLFVPKVGSKSNPAYSRITNTLIMSWAEIVSGLYQTSVRHSMHGCS